MTIKKTSRKQATALHKKPRGGSGWLVGLLIGLMIGGCVVFYLLAVKPTWLANTTWSHENGTVENKKDAVETSEAGEKKKSSGPRFDFYKLLSENSKAPNAAKPNTTPTAKPTVSAFDSDNDATNKSITPTVSTPSATTSPVSGIPIETQAATADSKLPGKYLLQAGSFRSNSDADKVRANIILLGLPARVESVKNDKGETFYRVYVGSFETSTDMQKAQDKLKTNKISAVVIKQK